MNKNSTKIILAVVLLLAAVGVYLWQSGMFASRPEGAAEVPEQTTTGEAAPTGEKPQRIVD